MTDSVESTSDPDAANGRDTVGDYIRTQREAAELSLRKLATIAGVSNPYLSQIERGLRRPSADILQAIARALQISAESLYVRAGILDTDHVVDVNDDTEKAIRRDPRLTPSQRRTLIEAYRSLIGMNKSINGETKT